MANKDLKEGIYYASIRLEQISCFKESQTLELSTKEGKPAKVTVILGDNGTGKTTLLKGIIAGEPIPYKGFSIGDGDERSSLKNVTLRLALIPLDWNGNLESKYAIQKADKITTGSVDCQVDNFGLSSSKSGDFSNISKMNLFPYGASRKLSLGVQLTEYNPDKAYQLFFANEALPNAEEWFIRMDYGVKSGVSSAVNTLQKIHNLLTSILPDVSKLEAKSEMLSETEVKNYLTCETPYGWVPLRELSFGYQTMFAWAVDLARRMFHAYPKSDMPLEEPAVVLVDEIDLHLHPNWQRKVIKQVTQHFPKTQFIFTSHSPLVVQSVEKLNLAILRRDGDHVTIENRQDVSYAGWTVEEILEDLMGVEEPYSDRYLEAVAAFEKGLAEENYAKIKKAYDKLDKMLHPNNELRSILRIQMSGYREEMQS